jgi:lipoprotein-releasing system ATP-binding protein
MTQQSAIATAGSQALVEVRAVRKVYRTAAGDVPVLQDLDLSVPAGEMLGIVGASGVGKSTLLHVLGTLDRPDAGSVHVAGEDVFALPEPRLRAFRNRTIGFVFQFHQLLPEFNALENVMMPLLIARRPEAEARARARQLLADMDLTARAEHRPGALSGGEQQRVAVARALAQGPRLLLADEPSGNLDKSTGDRLHERLQRLKQDHGLTLVVVTHNERLAAVCDRVLRLDGGRLHALDPGRP